MISSEENRTKICAAFYMEEADEAYRHIRENFVFLKSYGDFAYGHTLYVYEEGKRVLGRCKACDRLILVQNSEYHSHSAEDDDSYYSDYYPLEKESDAEELNRRYNGNVLERRFEGRFLSVTNYHPVWRENPVIGSDPAARPRRMPCYTVSCIRSDDGIYPKFRAFVDRYRVNDSVIRILDDLLREAQEELYRLDPDAAESLDEKELIRRIDQLAYIATQRTRDQRPGEDTDPPSGIRILTSDCIHAVLFAYCFKGEDGPLFIDPVLIREAYWYKWKDLFKLTNLSNVFVTWHKLIGKRMDGEPIMSALDWKSKRYFRLGYRDDEVPSVEPRDGTGWKEIETPAEVTETYKRWSAGRRQAAPGQKLFEERMKSWLGTGVIPE